jgi:hypothetical protein
VSKRTSVTIVNGPSLFILSRLPPAAELKNFDCSINEYNEYLIQEAHRSERKFVSLTWLLRERKDGNLVAYMSLINDAIKLNTTEKNLHQLDYPFKTIPAMKIAKLAVSESCRSRFSGIGTYMINLASFIAVISNEQLSACRFLTVDADVEHNESVIEFYLKNGFLPNNELNSKRSKTISMRKDILIH